MNFNSGAVKCNEKDVWEAESSYLYKQKSFVL